MVIINDLLPPNSTDFEHRVTLEMANNTELAAPIDTLSSPNDAPAEFLSFLAWQYSVDSWDVAWQPSLQRALIGQSFRGHQIKGTITAIREILSKFGYEAKFTEWWQTKPPLPAGSFTLELSTAGRELSESVYQEINRLINDAKPVSRHLKNLQITLTPKAIIYLGVALHMGDETIIYPKEAI
ncbi:MULTISPECIES: phage tail protein I [Moraxella]|uniref:Tail protein I n=1 Tax=Moraxella catarrhalis TaxID=480 RepID=A0A7Z0UXT1_MORCA|nr:phage tail protein I [Moraxella catarrhalis]OAV00223.1 Tail protein I [Moraxella catarrhalis]STY82492.1 Bacteriophage P2-related tail formation protein [Moraxella catarrhalis]